MRTVRSAFQAGESLAAVSKVANIKDEWRQEADWGEDETNAEWLERREKMVVFRVSATGNEIGGPASSATDGFEFRSRFYFHMKIALT